MSDLQKLRDEMMEDPDFRACYYEMKPSMDIAKAVIAGRMQLNITQKELAKLSGLSQAKISRIENFDGNPNLKTLNRIANAMNLMVKIELVPFPTKNGAVKDPKVDKAE